MQLSSLNIGSGGTKFEIFHKLSPYLLNVFCGPGRLSDLNSLQVQYVLSWISNLSLSGFQLSEITVRVVLLPEGYTLYMFRDILMFLASISLSFCLDVKGLWTS